MKKIVKLTESDLTRIVRRVITEQESVDIEAEIDALDENDVDGLDEILKKIGRSLHKFARNNKLSRMLRKIGTGKPKYRSYLKQLDGFN
jgi:ribosomal protein L12E/L44/L45/RPP1/RPP2